MCKFLLQEQAELYIYDPKVNKEEMEREMLSCGADETLMRKHMRMVPNVYEALNQAHALAVVTEWTEFATLDFERIFKSMVKPAFAYDGRNILPHGRMRSIGFEVYSIGAPAPNEMVFKETPVGIGGADGEKRAKLG